MSELSPLAREGYALFAAALHQPEGPYYSQIGLVLSRPVPVLLRVFAWEARDALDEAQEETLQRTARAVFHLAGKPPATTWLEKAKERLSRSREDEAARFKKARQALAEEGYGPQEALAVLEDAGFILARLVERRLLEPASNAEAMAKTLFQRLAPLYQSKAGAQYVQEFFTVEALRPVGAYAQEMSAQALARPGF